MSKTVNITPKRINKFSNPLTRVAWELGQNIGYSEDEISAVSLTFVENEFCNYLLKIGKYDENLASYYLGRDTDLSNDDITYIINELFHDMITKKIIHIYFDDIDILRGSTIDEFSDLFEKEFKNNVNSINFNFYLSNGGPISNRSYNFKIRTKEMTREEKSLFKHYGEISRVDIIDFVSQYHNNVIMDIELITKIRGMLEAASFCSVWE